MVVARARRVVAAAVLAGAVGTLAAGTASAAQPGAAYVLADVQCDTGAGHGVVDVTLVNDDAQSSAVFVVAGGSPIEVGALSATALTYTGVADGAFHVAVTVDGADASVNLSVKCATAVEVRPSPRGGEAASLPVTGQETTWGLAIGGVLVLAGIAASLLARRRYS